MAELSLNKGDFQPLRSEVEIQQLSRPSLSYWQDAWQRLRGNGRALLSLWIVIGLVAFTLVGPVLWDVDPSYQDVDQISRSPFSSRRATIVAPYLPWDGSTLKPPASGIRLAEPANTQAVRLLWDPIDGVTGYRIFRDIFEPIGEVALGLPLGEVRDPEVTAFEDLLDLDPGRYYYHVVGVTPDNQEVGIQTLQVDVERVITADEAIQKGLLPPDADPRLGEEVTLALHPLGTDYLGRDMLARLMHGARVSLFIGLVAPLFFVLLGVIYGSTAGFVGGMMDQALMRFADFVVALPFLLFMILFRVATGIQAGESGIMPMLFAMVLLSWPATARLVRGQILQIREEGYISASRLLGARTNYLVMRHMIPNTMGVILVTITFAVPSAIFTEAFLSFIGMGVAPPTPSWGSMCNEGVKTMLTHPHELIFPALFISVTVLAFNLLGDGLRDALDARMRSNE